MRIFQSDWQFSGKAAHALTEMKNKGFCTHQWEVLSAAALLGFLEQRIPESTATSTQNKLTTTIFVAQLLKAEENGLDIAFRTIFLRETEESLKDRGIDMTREQLLNQIFKSDSPDKRLIELFRLYILGGLEVLDDVLFASELSSSQVNRAAGLLMELSKAASNENLTEEGTLVVSRALAKGEKWPQENVG